MIRGAWPLYKRELRGLFVTPLAWTLLTSFLGIQGLHFFLLVSHYASQADLAESSPLQAFFGQTVLLYLPLLFICPLLTMRLFAEERRSGTLEPLMTAPVDPLGVVLGKYLAVLTTYASLWVGTLLYVVLLAREGELDWAVVGTSYAAVLSVGAGYLALGLFASALSSTQLGAALLATTLTVGLFMLGLGEFIFDEGPLSALCGYVSVWTQMNEWSRGIVDLRRLVFDGSLIVLPLFITVRAVDAWRWG